MSMTSLHNMYKCFNRVVQVTLGLR